MPNQLSKLAKFLILFFVFIYSIFIVIATFSCRGGFLDGNNIILSAMQELYKSSYAFFHMSHRWRASSLVLYALPMNITYWVVGAKKIPLLLSYYFGLFFLPFAILIFQYFLSKRLKNMLPFVISSFFFIFFIMVQFAWGISELPVASMLYIILITYFVSNAEFKKTDYLIVFLLSVYLLWSHELLMFLAPLLLIFSVLFSKKYPDSKNNKIRFLITFASLIGALFILIFFSMKAQVYDFSELTNSLHVVLENFYKSSFLISLAGMFFLVKPFIVKEKNVSIAESVILLVILLYICCLLSNILNGPNFSTEIHFKSLAYYVAVLIFFLLLIVGYLDVKISDTRYNNLIIIIFLVGIAQTVRQINISFMYHDALSNYLYRVRHTQNKILYINPDRAEQKSMNKYNRNFVINCFGYSATSIAFARHYKIMRIALPAEDSPGYCSADAITIENNGQIRIQGALYDVKTPFWDLSNIKKQIEDTNSSK